MHGRIKGSVLVSAVKALRMQREKAEPLLSEAGRRYLNEERVMVGSWYPEQDAFEIFRAFAQLHMPGMGVKAWVEMGRVAALQHSREHYRHLMAERDTQQLMGKAGALFKNQHDTGELTATTEQVGQAAVTLVGFEALCSEWSQMIAGYLTGLVQATGSENVSVRIVERDFAKGDASFAVTWTEAQY